MGRKADVASNHYQLVVAKMKLKLKKHWTAEETALPRFGISFLQHTEKLNQSKITLDNRFQALQNLIKKEETTMEENLKRTKKPLALTCQEVLGLNNQHHKVRITIKTPDKETRKEEQENSN
ncbi:unnamed protein product [Schistosoma curassoni]|uniref:Uncharacterized protein n=1 Tax=Schistosoma curassoni TaxID=6186 RepID=A0A183KCZ8_9TREM|nr:unnamed protein product [Schistosoma curassoni]